MSEGKLGYLDFVETKYEFLEQLLKKNNLTSADLPLRFRTIMDDYSRWRCFAKSRDFNTALGCDWSIIPVCESDRKELEWLVDVWDQTEIMERYNTLFGCRYRLTKDI